MKTKFLTNLTLIISVLFMLSSCEDKSEIIFSLDGSSLSDPITEIKIVEMSAPNATIAVTFSPMPLSVIDPVITPEVKCSHVETVGNINYYMLENLQVGEKYTISFPSSNLKYEIDGFIVTADFNFPKDKEVTFQAAGWLNIYSTPMSYRENYTDYLAKGWTQEDMNEDTNQWKPVSYGAGVELSYHYDENADDWLISPGFDLVANTKYRVSFDIKNQTKPYLYDLRLYLSQSNQPQNISFMSPLLKITESYSYFTQQVVEFTPQVTGKYYFLFHDATVGDIKFEDNYRYIYLRNFCLDKFFE